MYRLLALVVLGLAVVYSRRPVQIDITDYAARVDHILSTTPLIDGHNNLPYLLRLELQNQIYNTTRFTFDSLASHTDLETGSSWRPVLHAVRDILKQIDVTHRLITSYPQLHACTHSSCIKPTFSTHRISSMLGAEGLHQTSSSIAVIRELFTLGVCYITLTHNCDNPFATVTATGHAAVHEMNRLGMMVDLSDVSHETMRKVLDVTRSPVIFSHSACYALAKNYRNEPDDVLARLKENGGVIMIMFVKRFLNAEEPEKADLDTAVEHIFHAAGVAGWGADFDGTLTLANGIDDVSAYPRLLEAVMRRGGRQMSRLGGW